MLPELFGVSTYWTLIAGGTAIGAYVAWRAGDGWGLFPGGFVLLQLYLTGAAFLGGKVQYVLERGVSHAAVFSEGLRYVGAIGAALLALLLAVRLRIIKIPTLGALDSCAIGTCVALAVARLGCFLEGCCSGRITDGVLGVTFPPASPSWREQVMSGALSAAAIHPHPVHPLQLYYAAWWATLAALLAVLAARRPRPGTLLFAFLSADGLARWVLEGFRFQPVSANAHSGLLLALLGATVLLAYLGMRAFPGRTPARS